MRLGKMLDMIVRALALALMTSLVASPSSARPRYTVDRAVMLIRHGIRAPLDGEAAAAPLARAPFPQWDTPASHLTPHGAAALRILAQFERGRLLRQGLLPAGRCPTPNALTIWTNSLSRTIASGHALAEGLAPGCPVAVDHRAEGDIDPLFNALEARAVPFDATQAAASINAELQDGNALMRGTAAGFAATERVLGCASSVPPCTFAAMPNRITPSADGKGISLSGAIDLTSGTAQVFLLQYAEGFPMQRVGWGRASAKDIQAMSLLHARLFDVFARSAYMAPRVGGLIARVIATDLSQPKAHAVRVYVGHDNTIAAVTAILGVHFTMPGYGADDPPIGGGLLFERLTDRRTHNHVIRLSYIAQTPSAARYLSTGGQRGQIIVRHLPIERCGTPCSLPHFQSVIERETTLPK